MTPEEVCAALECAHLDIPWDPELVRVWSHACVLRRDPAELAGDPGGGAAWNRLAELASRRLREAAPAAGDATWEVIVDHEDDVMRQPRAFRTRCDAVEAAFAAAWAGGAPRAVVIERDASGAAVSTRELRFG